jgi:arylsulfatase A-like enzyme
VGKWHVGNPDDKTMPTDLGFDKNIGGWISWSPGSFFWPYGCDDNGTPIRERASVPDLFKGGKEGEYLTDRLTDEAIQLLDNRNPDKPFFLNLWHYAVHNPKEAKPELVEKYKQKIDKMELTPTFRVDPKTGSKLLTSETNAVYAAMIESVDDSVGRVVKKIKEMGEYENTMFIFYSDNGSTTNDVPCSPLNGGKNSTYEAGERVPAFITWKGKIKPQSEYTDAVYLCDVYNTTLEAAGVQVRNKKDIDGLSLFPVFNGQKLPQREFVWYFPDTRERWAQRANAAIYDQKSGMKYIMFFNGDHDELYDINNDLGEQYNIIKENSHIAESLNERLVSFLNRYYKKMPPPPEQFEPTVIKRLTEDKGILL